MAESAPAGGTRGHQVRPLFWRLPLVAFVLVGLACLQFLDRTLQREYRTEAVTQAVQADALLETFIRQRVAFLHSIQLLVSGASSKAEIASRFALVAREIDESAPDVLSIFLLDGSGVVRDVYPPGADAQGIIGSNHFSLVERALALQDAQSARHLAMTGTVQLRDGGRGILVYDPIVRDKHVTGYIGGSLAYHSLFEDALGEQLQGHFAYRITDAAGSAIAVSPRYPESVASVITRDVTLPADQHWKLEVAIPRFQPFVPRVITWLVGALLLLLVILMVVREEARAERFAQHSFNLELLSRDLLDANLRLEERAQQVAQANRAKSRFLANVSHELRTPLNAIVGYNSLALEGLYGPVPPPLRTAQERVGAAAEHLLGLVNDVLDLSKIEVGRMEVSLDEVDVSALLDSVLTVIEPIAAAKDVRVDVVLARDLPRITTDPRHVRQILLNLASNAIKFTERGSVALIARRDESEPDRRLSISVQDTGIGIAEQDLERIFEEFEQVRPAGRGDSLQRGTGLGLAISRKLARLLGGDVYVESSVGAGSRFTLMLPHETLVRPVDADTPADAHRPLGAETVSRTTSADGRASGVRALASDSIVNASDAPSSTPRTNDVSHTSLDADAHAVSGLDDAPTRG
jgi:signal transduction histidine kinase